MVVVVDESELSDIYEILAAERGGTGRNQSHSRRSCKMNGAYLENFPRLSESEMPRMQDSD
jgi:hypothetical protein